MSYFCFEALTNRENMQTLHKQTSRLLYSTRPENTESDTLRGGEEEEKKSNNTSIHCSGIMDT